MLAAGGKWENNGVPAFNSPQAVKATTLYRELFKYSPPGGATYDWSNALEAFRSGKVAFMIESTPFADWMEDPKKSSVVDKVGYVRPPAPLPSAAYGHGLAISATGAKDECTRQAAGKFIAFATGKEQEQARLKDNVFSDYNRTSTINSDYFRKHVKPQIQGGLTDTTRLARHIWPARVAGHWRQPGRRARRSLYGHADEVQSALDEANEYATEVVSRAKSVSKFLHPNI